jgi:C4-dicarboxylate transporter, DctM subunit
VIYLGLGMVLKSLSMMLLTVPVFLPIVQAPGIDPVWSGSSSSWRSTSA